MAKFKIKFVKIKFFEKLFTKIFFKKQKKCSGFDCLICAKLAQGFYNYLKQKKCINFLINDGLKLFLLNLATSSTNLISFVNI